MLLKILIISIILGLLPLSASADFYKYHDESGGVNVTNDYKSVPERYRSGVIVVRDADLEKKALTREKNARRERARYEKQRQRNEAEKAQRVVPESSPAATSAVTDSPKEAAGVAQPVRRRLGWLERQLPLLKVCGVIALIIAAVVFVMRLIRHLVPGTVGTIIRIAIFFGVSVYVFSAYSERVAKAFEVLKSEADVVQKAVDKRTERIEKQAEGRE